RCLADRRVSPAYSRNIGSSILSGKPMGSITTRSGASTWPNTPHCCSAEFCSTGILAFVVFARLEPKPHRQECLCHKTAANRTAQRKFLPVWFSRELVARPAALPTVAEHCGDDRQSAQRDGCQNGPLPRQREPAARIGRVAEDRVDQAPLRGPRQVAHGFGDLLA